MTTNSIIPTTVNPDLQKERNAASFDVEEFAIWWHGGVEKLKFKREIEQYLTKDLKDDNTLIHYKSHEEIYNIAVQQSLDTARKLRELQQKYNPGGTNIWPKLFNSEAAWATMPAGNPFSVQFVMVVPALKSQATDEQYERFGKPTEKFQICSTYAQTELGHGTFLRGLETRAEYDRATEEFVLNTPTISSYKWWPGGLGHSSNYCIVVAQLFIDEKPKGIEMFFVPLRDKETHLPLPGIEIGEIGKKLGFYGVNNGYLGLKNVRVPRTNMLMRNAQVLPDGTYVKGPTSVLTYFTMVYVRCTIARNNAWMLMMSATIATRYSAVRRQSPIKLDEPEPQIIDHVTQQLKLFPEIAAGIAHRLAADDLWALYDQTYEEIKSGKLSRLQELHSLSCVLKVLCSSDSSAGAERLRLACGGHGFLTSSYLGTIYISASAACTYEGENTVLLLQVGRFLIKSWRSALYGETLAPTVAYLSAVAKDNQFGKWSGTWENLVQAMKYVAANKTRVAFESLSARLKSGQSAEEAANNTGIELIQAAQLHGRALICTTFLLEVTNNTKVKQRSLALNKVLENLLELYLVNILLNHLNDVLRFIYLNDSIVRQLQTRLEGVLKKLRPDAVAICDGFDFHDRSLSSTLGSYDGNVYERIFELAKKSPLNSAPVPKSFEEHLKPFMKSNM